MLVRCFRVAARLLLLHRQVGVLPEQVHRGHESAIVLTFEVLAFIACVGLVAGCGGLTELLEGHDILRFRGLEPEHKILPKAGLVVQQVVIYVQPNVVRRDVLSVKPNGFCDLLRPEFKAAILALTITRLIFGCHRQGKAEGWHEQVFGLKHVGSKQIHCIII